MDNFLNDLDSKLFNNLSKSSHNLFFYYADMKKFVARWSDSAVEYFGLPSNILNPATIWDEKVHPDDLPEYQRNMAAMMNGETPYHNVEYRITNAKGEYVWVNCHGYMTYDENGEAEFFAGYVNNMGQISKIDPVTGLWTQYGFRSKIASLLEKEIHGAAMQIDIRNFKQINAQYGYNFGDKVLYAVGKALQKVCRKMDASAFRIESAHFALCLEGGKDEVLEAHKLLGKYMRDVLVDGRVINLEYSVAATVFPRDGEFLDRISNNLSYALASAKQKNTRNVVFYSKELYEERNRLIHLTETIGRCVENDFEGFRIVMQPIIDAATGKVHSAEALLRWSHKDFPDIGPMDFVPILESTDDIIPVGKWVIDRALRYIADWNKSYATRKLKHVNVNFSYIQFKDKTLKDYVVSKLDEYDLPHETLVAELTESCRIDHTEQFAKILQGYRDEGISIALDDFGTGYASLIVLKDTPTDIVKLDHTMTRTIKDRPKDRSLVEFIIKYCRKMNIDVCTEGVENENILNIVKSAGTELMQGYYFDKPLEMNAFYDKYVK